ncbi:unnamed protein product [Ceratitis capitata]|uniref:(Mediterranean fruit fly) hypothetical protein n=1 Tax=Ceratitis capitata TaxID=7213 RepID=A0A811V8S9_CERCA|nr:unnamed protein product [Ceratitis capitata]
MLECCNNCCCYEFIAVALHNLQSDKVNLYCTRLISAWHNVLSLPCKHSYVYAGSYKVISSTPVHILEHACAPAMPLNSGNLLKRVAVELRGTQPASDGVVGTKHNNGMRQQQSSSEAAADTATSAVVA